MQTTYKVELTEREIALLKASLGERYKAIKRKRSWTASVKVMSLVQVEELYHKLKALESGE